MDLAQSHEKEDQDKPHTGSVTRDLLLAKESVPEAPPTSPLPKSSWTIGLHCNVEGCVISSDIQLRNDFVMVSHKSELHQTNKKKKSLSCCENPRSESWGF